MALQSSLQQLRQQLLLADPSIGVGEVQSQIAALESKVQIANILLESSGL